MDLEIDMINILENEDKFIDIKKMIKEEMNYFEHQIKLRGYDYYNNENIKSLVKAGNNYIARVRGTAYYEVNIYIDEDVVDCSCNCPCSYCCKHEYAVLVAILNDEYKEVELKPNIEKNKISIDKLLDIIPADELKEFILSKVVNENINLKICDFENNFMKYFPAQSYEYYYNNLYNDLIVYSHESTIINSFLNDTKFLLNLGKFDEAFNIIKAIIEALHDTNNLDNWDELIDKFPLIFMDIRIIYRKSDLDLKDKINKWINKLESNNYYNSFYLEDMVLTIK